MPEIPITDSVHWHEMRATRIGGSEVAALFGCSPYLSHWALWQIKAGKLDGGVGEDERMFWGRWLQNRLITGAVARGLIKSAILYGSDEVDHPTAYIVHPTISGMGATPDAIGRDNEGRHVVIEAKCVDWLQYRNGWDDGEPPLHICLQGQHMLACDRSLDGVLFLALVGGNELKTHYEPRRPNLIRDIEQRVVDFWESIAAGIEPPVDGHRATTAGVKQLFPEDTGEVLMLDDGAIDLCARFIEAKERSRSTDAEVAAAANEIKLLVGDARKALCGGFAISWPADARGVRRFTVREL